MGSTGWKGLGVGVGRGCGLPRGWTWGEGAGYCRGWMWGEGVGYPGGGCGGGVQVTSEGGRGV